MGGTGRKRLGFCSAAGNCGGDQHEGNERCLVSLSPNSRFVDINVSVVRMRRQTIGEVSTGKTMNVWYARVQTND